MEILNKDNLYLYFQKNIEDEVGRIVEKLQSEISTLKFEAEKAIEQEIHEDQQNLLQITKQELARDFQDKLAANQRELDLAIMEKRTSLINQLFAQLEKHLRDFVTDKNYETWLVAQVNKMNLSDCAYVEVDVNDHIVSRYFPNIEIRPVKDLIAGFIFHTKNGKMIFDQSLKTKMEESKNWFYNHSHWFSERGVQLEQ